jgi:ABC-type histidine transport system ATPase subunit
MLQDLRYALRTLARSPGLSLAAVLTLGLGIGANTAMFGVVDRLFFRPPAHVVDPDRVVRVSVTKTVSPLGSVTGSIGTYPRYVDFRNQVRGFSAVAAHRVLGMLDTDWTGEYRFLDHAVHALKPKQRIALNKQHIGFVFQQYHLLDDLTVAENLDVPLSYRDIKKSERQALVADTLDRFGIVAKKDLFPRSRGASSSSSPWHVRSSTSRP